MWGAKAPHLPGPTRPRGGPGARPQTRTQQIRSDCLQVPRHWSWRQIQGVFCRPILAYLPPWVGTTSRLPPAVPGRRADFDVFANKYPAEIRHGSRISGPEALCVSENKIWGRGLCLAARPPAGFGPTPPKSGAAAPNIGSGAEAAVSQLRGVWEELGIDA